MRDAVGFARGAIAFQRGDGALPDEMHRRGVLVQVGEDRSERLTRVQLLRGLRVFGLHVDHEMGVAGEQSHLAFRIAAVGAMGVGLNEFADGDAIRRFLGGYADVFAHHASRIARVSRNASMPYWPYSRPTPEYLNPPQGACGSSVMPLITTRPARNREATRRAR
jgi:hypothetical protein